MKMQAACILAPLVAIIWDTAAGSPATGCGRSLDAAWHQRLAAAAEDWNHDLSLRHDTEWALPLAGNNTAPEPLPADR